MQMSFFLLIFQLDQVTRALKNCHFFFSFFFFFLIVGIDGIHTSENVLKTSQIISPRSAGLYRLVAL